MKKKINIILLFLVVILWVTVIYKYAGSFLNPQSSQQLSAQVNSLQPLPLKQKDTFEFLSIARDPFLDKYITKRKTIVQHETNVNRNERPIKNFKKTDTKEVAVELPKIEYYGYIKSTNQESQLVLIKLNHKLFRLRVGQSEQGVKVMKINNDSVLITYNGISKSIKKTIGF